MDGESRRRRPRKLERRDNEVALAASGPGEGSTRPLEGRPKGQARPVARQTAKAVSDLKDGAVSTGSASAARARPGSAGSAGLGGGPRLGPVAEKGPTGGAGTGTGIGTETKSKARTRSKSSTGQLKSEMKELQERVSGLEGRVSEIQDGGVSGGSVRRRRGKKRSKGRTGEEVAGSESETGAGPGRRVTTRSQAEA